MIVSGSNDVTVKVLMLRKIVRRKIVNWEI